jgi:DUF2914 family protein/tetratricopeptide repeat protein
MSDRPNPAPLIEAAEQSAAAGEYLAAEQLLRDAAAIQEATLGPSHADLATTLNNLAFVCERTNKIDEAERGYRRAHAIAVASLPPRHPLTVTSLKNLMDFCAAHQIPVWKPPAVELDEETSSPEDRSVQNTGPVWLTFRKTALSAFGLVVIVALVLTMKGRGVISPKEPPAREETTAAITPKPEPAIALDRPRETTSAPIKDAKPPETTVTPASVTVLNAQLCSLLEKRGSPDWQCTAANGELQPGTYTFYTRLLTDANTTVEHRWYRDERVHQVVRLHVIASPGSGYRTFSSTTISPGRAGDWKVELRAADGTLLQEARFVVR